jgi:hypothetical protein
MKFLIRLLALLSIAVVAAGCVTTTPNFSARPDFWQQQNAVIGVAIAELPKPTAYKAGSQGLLDVAINNAAGGTLEQHLNTLDISRIEKLSDRIATYLTGRGFKIKQIKEPIKLEALNKIEQNNASGGQGSYIASRDFTSLKAKYEVDKLVLVTVSRVGTIRNYYGFIPLGAPAGISNLQGQAINLKNNGLEWNQSVSQIVPSADANWDQPPDFPGLTKAVHSAFDQTRDLLYNNFVQ